MNTITPQKNPWEWEHGWLRQSHDKSKKANVVIKVGGSLFSTSGWQHAVQSLIADEALSNHSVVVIAGGGALVDGLRLIDSNSSLPSPLMHGLALEAMGITAQFLASTLKLPLREEVGADSPFVLNMRKWAQQQMQLPRFRIHGKQRVTLLQLLSPRQQGLDYCSQRAFRHRRLTLKALRSTDGSISISRQRVSH